MNIIDEAQKYVTDLFKEHSDDKLRYHNIEHTKNVVKAARLIASKCKIHLFSSQLRKSVLSS
ncbi:MAG: hypothetical protein K9H16_00595 [Bacteroidales bacterium]|nr:hypothetical protein [Bacteroidales bacterium]